jgi:hypothetical protein
MKFMEPIALIVTALAAGASSAAIEGLTDTAKENVKAAFAKLYELVRHRFEKNVSAEVILSEHQNDPATYEAALAKKLAEAGAASDSELVAAATALIVLLDHAGAGSGKYNVTIMNSKGIQVGDGNTQLNKF